MKSALNGCVFILLLTNICNAQQPDYSLKVMNFLKTSPNSFVFDVYIENTGFPIYFEYSGGQYFLDINPAIANGGALSYAYAGPDTSDLPPNLRPRNPQVFGSQLRLAANSFPSAGSGYIIPNGSPGTKIVKMKVTTTASEFAEVPVNLTWRNQDDPFTKIYAFVGSVNTNITTSSSHYIDTTSLHVYPQYSLTAGNLTKISGNTIQFDIFIKHTNPPAALDYSGGQYYFNFNPMIANGGTLAYTYAGDTSDLPLHLRPINPQVSGNQLNLESNSGDVNYDNFCDINDMERVDNDSYIYTSGNVITLSLIHI